MERRNPERIYCVWTAFFPLFDLNDILEREWWLMYHLKLGFNDIQSMPWDELEWFYNRHNQHLIDMEREQNEANGVFG